jgi:hypothetical protein
LSKGLRGNSEGSGLLDKRRALYGLFIPPLRRLISRELLEEPFVALTTPLRVLFSSLGCLSMVLRLEVLGGFLPEDPPVAFFYFPFGG